MIKNVRVRFAPSPTGPLHIGGVRTALFNYLFAKKHNGTFILRIEDTDQSRYVANAEKYILNSLEWCNIPFDEGPDKNEKFGPYRQSNRNAIYRKYADKLVDLGKAYYAFDSPESLDRLRKEGEQKKRQFIYNHTSREYLNNSLVLNKHEVDKNINNGLSYVIRFLTPLKTIKIYDHIRGDIQIDTSLLDDKILFKSDGMPTYHLANVVDDYLMKISHVIRGEEWLPSMALHILLYEAFGWQPPNFAHLPLILKPTGKGKLSKRDGEKLGITVFPLDYTDNKTGQVLPGYREKGYFSEALVNSLALLGWNPGTPKELFNLSDLIEHFSLERVNKSGARFNPEKIIWLNGQYLQLKSNQILLPLIRKELGHLASKISDDKLLHILGLVKKKAVFIKDFKFLMKPFFEAPVEFDKKALKKIWKQETIVIIKELINVIEAIEYFTVKEIRSSVDKFVELKEISFNKVMQPLRLSLIGALHGPDLFELISIIGKQESLKRLTFAVEKNI